MTDVNTITMTFLFSFVLVFFVGLLGYTLGRIIPPRRKLARKYDRYESGNPPIGSARGLFTMQYYPYVIMFLVVEPISIFLIILSLAREYVIVSGFYIFLTFLTLIPPLIYGLKEAERIELWLVREE